MPEASRRAAHAALTVQRVAAGLQESAEHALRYRVSVAVGDLDLHELGGLSGRRLPVISGTAVQRVVAAVRAAAGEDPIVLPSMGGSVPMYDLTRLGAPLAILPIANHDNNQHAADENLRLGNLFYGVDVMKALLG